MPASRRPRSHTAISGDLADRSADAAENTFQPSPAIHVGIPLAMGHKAANGTAW